MDPDGVINDHRAVSSVVKNGTGDFTVNLVEPMITVHYHVSVMVYDSSNDPILVKVVSKTTSSFRFQLRGGEDSILGVTVCKADLYDPDIGISVYACA